MTQSLNVFHPDRSDRGWVLVNVALTWVCAVAMAASTLAAARHDPNTALWGALATGRSLVVAALVTSIARRSPGALPLALLAAASIQLVDGLCGLLWAQWGLVGAFAVAAVHLAGARRARRFAGAR